MADWGASLNNLMPGAPTHFGPDINAILSAQRNALALQQAQQVLGAQNALGRAYADQQNLVPGTNQLTPQAISSLASRSPLAVTDALKMNANMAQQQSLNQFRQSENFQRWVKEGNTQADQILSEYDANLKNGVDPKQALADAQGQYSQMITGLGASGMPPNMRQMINPTFDPTRIRARQDAANVAKLREKQAEILVEAEKERAVSAAKQQANPEYAVPMQTGEGVKDVPVVSDGKGGWRLAAPPNTPVQDVSGLHKIGTKADAAAKVAQGPLLTAKTPDGKDREVRAALSGVGYVDANDGRPLVPGTDYVADSVETKKPGAATQEAARATAEAIYDLRQPPLSSYSMRSGTGPMIMEELKKIGDEKGVPYNAQNYATGLRLRTGYASTTPNSAGGQMNSTNTAVQHLDQLKILSDALKNKDQPALNKVINYVQTQLGHPEVTNFDTAAQIISDEVLKSVIGTGAVFDRAALQAQLQNTRSPSQIEGGIRTVEGLMGGRLNAMRHQWTSIGLPEAEWESKLTPEAMDAIGPYLGKEKSQGRAGGGKVAELPKPDQSGVYNLTDPSQIDSLPPGSHFRAPGDPAGSYRLKP